MEGDRLTVNDLACRRGDRLLFRSLSFELGAGEALQVVGANGTGKSSLLRIIAGLLRPYSGTVERTGDVGLLDEKLALDENIPLGQALAIWEQVDGGGYGAGAVARAGLEHLLDVPVRFLSTGQRKRAAILMSCARMPQIWLLDEPLNGLDVSGVAGLVSQVAEYCAHGGIAVIASHQPFALDGLKRIDLADYVP